MESWSLKVAGGFLAALLVTGSGFQLLGTPKPRVAGTGSEQRRARSPSDSALGLQRHAPHKRDVTKHPCEAGYHWYSPMQRCCQQCPAGQFMKAPCTSHDHNTTCERCPHGTYLASPNFEKKCRKCSECHAPASQLMVKNCTESSDAQCGCGPGHFLQCTASACRDFTCQECHRCQGKVTLQNCSMKADTQCGECQSGFYLEGSECRACATQLSEKCIDGCGRACDGSSPGFGLEYVLLGLMGPLFLGALFIYHRRRTLSAESPAAGNPALLGNAGIFLFQVSACLSGAAEKPPEVQGLHHLQVTEASQMSGNACPARPLCSWDGWESRTARQETARPLLGTLQQGSTLYAIINAVPLRRWKELMRVLELPDTEIEVVEMEFAHVRDQQYEMLKRWCQQKNTTLESIFSALERMELAGCAEELRQQLQKCP
ncbi:tumor necrosis factor receptor superfamily member 25 [Emydura macquarii macquarii]|uniref:tumor necrosis factor receptor superfamily member 25 n=1 Tax=Emydura macquarii macquarii TaxID=1129001 RepID=UPI00352AB822